MNSLPASNPTNPLRRLTSFETRWASAALGAIYPRPAPATSPVRVGILDLEFEPYLHATLARLPLEAALGIRLTIWIAAFAPIFFLGRWCTISGLSEDDRERLMDAIVMRGSYAPRQLIVTLKAFGAFFYAHSDAVRDVVLRPRAVIPLVSLRSPGDGLDRNDRRKGDVHEHRSVA